MPGSSASRSRSRPPSARPIPELRRHGERRGERLGPFALDPEWVEPPARLLRQHRRSRGEPQSGEGSGAGEPSGRAQPGPLAMCLAGGDPLLDDRRQQLVVEVAAGAEAHGPMAVGGAGHRRMVGSLQSVGGRIAGAEHRRRLPRQPGPSGPVAAQVHAGNSVHVARSVAAPAEVQRAWTVGCQRGSDEVAAGVDRRGRRWSATSWDRRHRAGTTTAWCRCRRNARVKASWSAS